MTALITFYLVVAIGGLIILAALVYQSRASFARAHFDPFISD